MPRSLLCFIRRVQEIRETIDINNQQLHNCFSRIVTVLQLLPKITNFCLCGVGNWEKERQDNSCKAEIVEVGVSKD